MGGNGTGKSNLLEVLACIFADLDLGRDTVFSYRIVYKVHGEVIDIEWNPELARNRMSVTVDGIKSSRTSLKAKKRRLPRFVFGYYSGANNRLASYFTAHEKRYYDLLKDKKVEGDPTELRPLFYAKHVHSQFVLIAFFSGDKFIREFLRDNLHIEGLDSVLFVTVQPQWAKGRNSGTEKFWMARGEVRDFLERLYEHSLAPLQQTWNVPLPFDRSTSLEHRYYYIPDEETLKSLAAQYSSEQRFFTALESTYLAGIVSEVRIKVRVRGADGSMSHRELSEGERQLLTVLGLLRFTRTTESLFLLDEPDTHLNPAWSLKYLDLLEEVVGDTTLSQLIIATHDPLVIAGLEKEQVRIFGRIPDSSAVMTSTPEQDPRGMGFAGLLTSDVYGLRAQLDLQTLQVLDRKRELATKPNLNEAELDELRELNKELSEIQLGTPIRDPLYKAFVEAMASLNKQGSQTTDSPVLTRTQQIEQRELAIQGT